MHMVTDDASSAGDVMDGTPRLKGMVSVIIPTYNRSARCKAAVESVIAQTYTNLEVIVVDDGSEDDTRAVIEGLPDGRIRYFYQSNAGVSAARNTGLAATRGEFVALLDSDDLWFPWKLEAQMAAMKAFPDAGMVWTDMTAVDENGVVLHPSYLEIMYESYRYFDRDKHFRSKRPLKDIWSGAADSADGRFGYAGNIFPWMFMGNLVHTSTVLLRKDRQERVGGFDVSLKKSGEDYDFHLRTSWLGDVAYLDVPSIYYRIGAADQLTSDSYRVWMARNNLKTVLNTYEKVGGMISLPKDRIEERFARSYAWAGMTEIFENPRSARKNLKKSLGIDGSNREVWLYYLLSFLPAGTICLIRDWKRWVNRRLSK